MPIDRYLELVKSALVNELYIELEAQLLMSVLCAAQGVVPDLAALEAVRRDRSLLDQLLSAKQDGHTILLERPVAGRAPAVDGNLRNYSEFSLTLVGRKRLDDLQHCVEDILDRGVPGDLLEVWVAPALPRDKFGSNNHSRSDTQPACRTAPDHSIHNDGRVGIGEIGSSCSILESLYSGGGLGRWNCCQRGC